jgi:anaerobic magnesium-protoporphyrin IX monomethyl ester cyclase
MARVLLLNPPAPGRITLRDFACGESTKADYYWAPIDLLVLSGVMSERHHVDVLDAAVEGLSADEALRRAAAVRPDAVFTLTAAVTLREDDAFLGRLKDRTGARVYGMGDVASFAAAQTLARTASFDGLVQNFADPSLADLAGGDVAAARSVVLRGADGPDARPVVRQKPLRYGRPRHELFPLHRYRMPFTRWRRSTTVMSAYGCPFPCTFCASRNLPWQLRPIEDVIDELRYVASLGLEEFYLRDFTFGPTHKRGLELCQALVDAKLPLRWSAECRIEVLESDLLEWMARAGCEVILVGVETGDTEVAQLLGKRYRPDRTPRLLAEAQRLGIRTCGHFVIGTPGETREQIEATIRYARDLPLDYASFNLYAPRLGTPMRESLVAQGRVDGDDFDNQDVSLQANPYAAVDNATLRGLFRRAVLGFYLRPTQLARLARHTPWSTLTRQGTGVLRAMLEARE